MSVALLINEEFATFKTDATKNFHKSLEELGVVHGTGKIEMSKMTRAIMVILTAGTANLTILQNTHTWIKETVEFTIGR
jgi:hypothetical protein